MDTNLSDEFNHSQNLRDWKFFHEEEGWPSFVLKADVDQSTPNQLHLEPQTGFWFGEVHAGPFIYKSIKGDFTVITKVKVSGRNTEVPKKYFSLAGLMVRKPRPTDVDQNKKKEENWLFLSTGFAKPVQGIKDGAQFETKVTINSKSKLKIHPAPNGWVEIAISRTGTQFNLSYKATDRNWQLISTIDHPQFREAAQIGIISYTDFNAKMKRRYVFNRKRLNTEVFLDGSPDVIANFDYFRVYPGMGFNELPQL